MTRQIAYLVSFEPLQLSKIFFSFIPLIFSFRIYDEADLAKLIPRHLTGCIFTLDSLKPEQRVQIYKYSYLFVAYPTRGKSTLLILISATRPRNIGSLTVLPQLSVLAKSAKKSLHNNKICLV